MNSVRPVSPVLVKSGFRIADIVVTVLAAYAAYEIYLVDPIVAADGKYAIGVVLAALLTANVFPLFGLYEERHWRNWFRQMARPLLAWTIVAALLIVAAFVTKVSAYFSRGWVIVWFIGGYIGFLAVRLALRAMLSRWSELGRLSKSVAVRGTPVKGGRVLVCGPAAWDALCGVCDNSAQPARNRALADRVRTIFFILPIYAAKAGRAITQSLLLRLPPIPTFRSWIKKFQPRARVQPRSSTRSSGRFPICVSRSRTDAISAVSIACRKI